MKILSLIPAVVLVWMSASADEVQTRSIEDAEEFQAITKPRGCPDGMIRVKGRALPSTKDDTVEILQDSTCKEWISTQFPARCAAFDEQAWRKAKSGLKTHQMDFCIDTYEFPNIKEEKPKVFVSYNEAAGTCGKLGKRLCTEEEWTFACEGEEGRPYPYGYERNSNACNIDRKWIEPDVKLLSDPKKRPEELDRLWQGLPSGLMDSCVSPFGVHDMTGNIDEFTVSVRKIGHRSILKGGYWSTVRNRCRPSTRVHGEDFAFYQQGFRCCEDHQ